MAPSETPADGQRPPAGWCPPYRPWAELLARTFAVDVLACPKWHGRMRLLAMVQDPANVARYLAAVVEATQVPPRSPGRGPPYWNGRVLRRQASGDEDDGQGRWVQETAQRGSRMGDGPRGGGACASSRIEANPAFSREGPASPSRARPGWQPPGMARPEEAC